MGKNIREHYNELALAEITLGKMWQRAKVTDEMDAREQTEYMEERAKAQYEGPQLESDFLIMITSFIHDSPDFVPQTRDDMFDCIKGLTWGLNAFNNALNYDFSRFGETRFKEALPEDTDKKTLLALAEQRDWHNIARLMR